MHAIAKTCIAFVMCLNLSLSLDKQTEIKLDVISDCVDAAALGWTVFSFDDAITFLTNCSVSYSVGAQNDLLQKPMVYHYFPVLKKHGVYNLRDWLLAGRQYWFNIKCGNIVSNAVSITALDNCTQVGNTTHSPDVVYQEQTGLFSSTQDSVLGIVIGLLGVIIILVTSFYLWKRYRNRQRRQRIRSYLGASLIDPFANMQNRMEEIEASGGQRLMGSTDSL